MPRGELSLSIAGLEPGPARAWSAGTRAALEWTASLGYRWVQLDGRSLKARDLDRGARRDVAALLRRLGLSVSGIDLWIPPDHFASATDADRAVSAATGALELVAELAGLVAGSRPALSLTIPGKPVAGVIEALAAVGAQCGGVVADHAWPVRAGGTLAVGVDPAALLVAGADPVTEVTKLAAMPVSARLSDLAAEGRVIPGAGGLDLAAYDAALAVRGFQGPRVVDLRGLRDQAAAAGSIRRSWSE